MHIGEADQLDRSKLESCPSAGQQSQAFVLETEAAFEQMNLVEGSPALQPQLSLHEVNDCATAR
jgi:hypothetical protein